MILKVFPNPKILWGEEEKNWEKGGAKDLNPWQEGGIPAWGEETEVRLGKEGMRSLLDIPCSGES